jgi:hypothetical protein
MRKLVIVLSAAALVVAFTLPAMAQSEWSFYGNARMWTEYKTFDKNNPSASVLQYGLIGANPFSGIDDEDELTWELQSNSRVGASVKAGDIGGRFEYGTGVNLRRLYGTWNFGAGQLLVGQEYTPLFFPISDQCGLGGGDCGLIFWGTVYTGRVPQLTLNWGGLKVGLLDPSTTGIFQSGGTAAGVQTVSSESECPTGTVEVSDDGVTKVCVVVAAGPDFTAVDVDQTLPKIEASYTFNLGPAALFIGGGYNTADVEGVLAADGTVRSESVDSWVVNAAAKMGFGAFYVNASVAFAQNPANYGLTQDIGIKGASYDFDNNRLEDCDSFFWALILGFKVSDMWKIEGGIGWISNSIDDPGEAGISYDEDSVAYYLQAAISPVKNFFIIPEVGYVDYKDLEVTGETDTDLGDATYFAIKWQINF